MNIIEIDNTVCLIHMAFRELLGKGACNKRTCLHTVHIAKGNEVDGGEGFSDQRWKQQQEKRRFNITINNPTVRRAYISKLRRLGMSQRRKKIRRCTCSQNGQQKRGKDRGREYKENEYQWGPMRGKHVTKRAGDNLDVLPVMRQNLDTAEESLMHLATRGTPCGPLVEWDLPGILAYHPTPLLCYLIKEYSESWTYEVVH